MRSLVSNGSDVAITEGDFTRLEIDRKDVAPARGTVPELLSVHNGCRIRELVVLQPNILYPLNPYMLYLKEGLALRYHNKRYAAA